ncbi:MULTISPECIES: DUF2789 domain-containing protein [unclassified Shewanella]|jgi:hypothetical protein|uniref:DUF2789 domain-containing protein n=1 Tax=unclassified Shewanella TaxID=196818 RepID=UPI000C34E9EB|nr:MULTISPECIES: DUF2789 domain-containing protein [unclassified Shewanella]MBB1361555.1 DUF2789 domain-containing protein [Shewanella sp. SR44-4]MBO1894808.1 DUF2789 domain-containing protein [Shewanella sp. BF02_Schw]PKH29242.1 DUF2789 domain-containing protein [Shewanella sp. ALD9]QHS12859.1 DUF2789 domain-containing protein [Shewanella sp. Arc9-LZ]
MDTTSNDLSHLFKQLGLPHDQEGIDDFVIQNKLDKHTLITDADCWNSGQKAFLKEALLQDAQWSEVIDQLDVMMRAKL